MSTLISVQSATTREIVGSQSNGLILRVEASTAVSVISVNSGGGGGGSGMPAATEQGQLLMSLDGVIFSTVQPMTSADDGWLVSADGDLLVEGVS